MLAPIVLFVYSRPIHTQKVLDALSKNLEAKDSILYVYADGPKENSNQEVLDKIQSVRQIINKENRFKEIVIKESLENKGLANSIISGVTEVVEKHGRVIVLEDDLVVSPYFLDYMNRALDFYQNKKQVYHINGCNFESRIQFILPEFYFTHFMNCWGWATWSDRWKKLDLDYEKHLSKINKNPKIKRSFDYECHPQTIQLEGNILGKIKTWAILWYASIFFNKGLCLTPKYSFVENIGHDGTGEHCGVLENRFKIENKVFHVSENAFPKKYKEDKFGNLHLVSYAKNSPKMHPIKVFFGFIIGFFFFKV